MELVEVASNKADNLMESYKLLFCFSAASIATSLHMLEPTVHGVCEISNAVKCRIIYPFVESIDSLHFAVTLPMGHLHAFTFLIPWSPVCSIGTLFGFVYASTSFRPMFAFLQWVDSIFACLLAKPTSSGRASLCF